MLSIHSMLKTERTIFFFCVVAVVSMSTVIVLKNVHWYRSVQNSDKKRAHVKEKRNERTKLKQNQTHTQVEN